MVEFASGMFATATEENNCSNNGISFEGIFVIGIWFLINSLCAQGYIRIAIFLCVLQTG